MFTAMNETNEKKVNEGVIDLFDDLYRSCKSDMISIKYAIK